MDIDLTLTVDEVNAILGLLGEMPTKTGIYPVALKIKQQAEAQMKPQEPLP